MSNGRQGGPAQGRGAMVYRGRRHRVSGALSVLFATVALIGVAVRLLPADLQALPFVPQVASVVPWFAIPAVLALVLALVSARYVTALVALCCIMAQCWWQYPFFTGTEALPDEAVAAVSGNSANTSDDYARVMTLNVYKGSADPAAIVAAVRDQRVEVLALQETTDEFVRKLEENGIKDYLPYSHVSSSDGAYGNGIWSASALIDVADDEVDSSASFMPAGTVTFGTSGGKETVGDGTTGAGGDSGTDADGQTAVRFVSVHTTAPVSPYWGQWKRSLDELGRMRSRTQTRYVFMGDFNATMDHAPFRNFLGTRFVDAAQAGGHGFALTWPTNRKGVPRFTAIDHIVLDQGMSAGQIQVLPVSGSDHAALLATIAVS